MIDRARQASSATLAGDFIANSLQVHKKAPKGTKTAASTETQLVDTASFTKLGATGLEPATS